MWNVVLYYDSRPCLKPPIFHEFPLVLEYIHLVIAVSPYINLKINCHLSWVNK